MCLIFSTDKAEVSETETFVQLLKACKLLLYQGLSEKLCAVVDKKTTKNVCFYLSLSRLYGNENLKKSTFNFIELNFNLVRRELNFLNLSLDVVQKVLSSCRLQIDSELEVVAAGCDWIGHKTKERSHVAVKLLSNVRLHLLSNAALNFILKNESPFSNCAACRVVVKNVMKSKHSTDHSCLPYTNRYNSQENYKIVAFCGERKSESFSNVYEIEDFSLKNLKQISSLALNRMAVQVVVENGKLFVLGGRNPQCLKNEVYSVETYSAETNSWRVVGRIPEKLQCIYTCSYMGKIYVFGGC